MYANFNFIEHWFLPALETNICEYTNQIIVLNTSTIFKRLDLLFIVIDISLVCYTDFRPVSTTMNCIFSRSSIF